MQDGAAVPTSSKRSKKQSAPQAAEAGSDTYKVPEGFDATELGQPDFSSKAEAERTLADLFVKRWWSLREQVCLTPVCAFTLSLDSVCRTV